MCEMAAVRARVRWAMRALTRSMVRPPCCWRMELSSGSPGWGLRPGSGRWAVGEQMGSWSQIAVSACRWSIFERQKPYLAQPASSEPVIVDPDRPHSTGLTSENAARIRRLEADWPGRHRNQRASQVNPSDAWATARWVTNGS